MQKTLMWTLATPLVVLLLLAIHPWSYVSSDDDTTSYDSGQGTPYDPSVEDDTSGDGDAGSSDTGTSTTDTSATETPSASAGAAAQAAQIDQIVEQSAGYRGTVQAAVDDATACGANAGLEQDATDLQEAADGRSDLSRQSTELVVDDVEHGLDVTTLLQEALDRSATVDIHFAAWATELQNGSCSPSSTTQQADYIAAVGEANDEATTAKQAFVDMWNPIAQTYALRSWRADQL